MALTPQDVRDQRFRERRKGYDVEEVDAFLERVTHELAALLDERDELRRRGSEGAEEPSELLARTLMTAQRTADDTIAAAQEEAQRILAEAREQAADMAEQARQRAESEGAALDAEAARVSRAAESLVRFRSEYRTRVRAVIAEQLALLERAGELPDVPPAIADLATYGEARIEARDDQSRYGDQPTHGDQASYEGQPAYEDQAAYPDEGPYEQAYESRDPASALGELQLEEDFFGEQGPVAGHQGDRGSAPPADRGSDGRGGAV